MPFFEEIVQWIEENCDARKVNFIVFYLSETLEKGIHEVVYVPTKNFRANLQRQRQKYSAMLAMIWIWNLLN